MTIPLEEYWGRKLNVSPLHLTVGVKRINVYGKFKVMNAVLCGIYAFNIRFKTYIKRMF